MINRNFNVEYYLQNLETDFIGRNIVYYSETNSTNLQAKENSYKSDGTVFIADYQKSGRGRMGREWKSDSGSGLWFSILLKPDISPENAASITLIAGIAVCTVMREYGFDAGIKWPNDIVVNGKKICGILNEMSVRENDVCYVVCGIGINVNNARFDGELSDKATSMNIEGDKDYEREIVLQKVLSEFEKCYKEFLKSGIHDFLNDYKSLCVTLNREVSIETTGTKKNAYAVDITSGGELVVEIDGQRRELCSGEVSVRGILGYF